MPLIKRSFHKIVYYLIIGAGTVFADVDISDAPTVFRKHPPHPFFGDNMLLQWLGLLFSAAILYLISYSIFSARLQSSIKSSDYSKLPSKLSLSSLTLLFWGLALALPAFLGNLVIVSNEAVSFGTMYGSAIATGIMLIFVIGLFILGFVMLIMGRH